MIVAKVRKVSNPRRSHKRRKNARRKMSDKQIRIFGTPAQKAALRRKRKAKANTRKTHRKRTRPVASNPKRKRRHNKRRSVAKVRRSAAPRKKRVNRKRRVHRAKVVRSVNPVRKRRRRTNKRRVRRARRSNPAQLAVLGYVNPRRKRNKKSMAKTHRRRHNTRRARRRRNTTVIISHPRKHNRRARRRNPNFMGYSGEQLVKIGGGLLVGVWATRLVPTLGPLAGIAGQNAFTASIVSAGSALLLGWGASKVSSDFGKGVLFGGIAEAITVFLDAFIPPAGQIIGLHGVRRNVGALVPGASFSVPQNPFYGHQPAGMAGLRGPAGRAYPGAY